MIWVYLIIFALFYIALTVLAMIAEEEDWEGAEEVDLFWIFILSVMWPVVLPFFVLYVLAAMIKVAIKEII